VARWPTLNRVITVSAVGGLFFPLAAQLGLPARSTVTTKVLQKAVWAGANCGSYPQAAAALQQLAEIPLSAKQVRRLVGEVGQARLAERDNAVAQLQTTGLPERRAGSRAAQVPELAVISMDGGRYQRRDHFRRTPNAVRAETHWRETKVGCLLSMSSAVQDCDPSPEFPDWLCHASVVAELAKIADKTSEAAPVAAEPDRTRPKPVGYDPPRLLAREIIASSDEAEAFGWQLEARAWQLGFPAAERQAFVADGLSVNWTIARRHFPRATPILDLMHALSYAWSAAMAVDQGQSYRVWAKHIWQGQVAEVIQQLANLQQQLGPPADDTPPNDPRLPVARALTYYRNNERRMHYPAYRQQGLPLTSSHIESTIKLINCRIKGTEKFWCQSSGNAVLQLRADCLSDSQPLTGFWRRWQAQQTGANCYRTAA
jgi:hypothetical protein